MEKFPARKAAMAEHVGNWLAAIRERGKLNSEIEEGHKSDAAVPPGEHRPPDRPGPQVRPEGRAHPRTTEAQ